jgi:hypothetical protein
MYPVLQDLLGKASVDDGDPLPQFFVKQGKLDPRSGGDPNNWAKNLFQPNGPMALFAPLPGTTNAIDNGGSHYYFWVGALGYAIFGTAATEVGFWRELTTKQKQGLGPQAEIQIANGRRGVELARCLEARLLLVEAKVTPTTGTVGGDLRLQLKIYMALGEGGPGTAYVDTLLKGPGFPGTVNHQPPTPVTPPIMEISVPGRLDKPGNFTWTFEVQFGSAGVTIRGEVPVPIQAQGPPRWKLVSVAAKTPDNPQGISSFDFPGNDSRGLPALKGNLVFDPPAMIEAGVSAPVSATFTGSLTWNKGSSYTNELALVSISTKSSSNGALEPRRCVEWQDLGAVKAGSTAGVNVTVTCQWTVLDFGSGQETIELTASGNFSNYSDYTIANLTASYERVR